MKTVHTYENTYTLNFEPGEDVVVGLMELAREKNIRAAHVTGLGAASKLTIAFYNLGTKEYEKKEFVEEVEILSLTGNIGVKEGGACVVHIHGVFGRRDYSTFGGHLFSLVISGAGEIHLTAFPNAIRRTYDEKTGLTLMREG